MNRQDDAVDVLLPTHCRPHTLGCAIRAVLRQTHPRFTLHVVGDGCDDATAAVVAGFDDHRLLFYRLPKAPGFGYANRNRVFRQSTAPFIAYAADDDLWFPDHLARGLAALARDGGDLTVSREAHVHPPDRVDPHFFSVDWRLGRPSAMLRDWFTGPGQVMHRRRVFDAVGYWNESLSRFGDREFLARARARVPYARREEVTTLRFYAAWWDGEYARCAEPPQVRYLERLADPTWCEALRAAARPGPRGLAVRRRQAADFLGFARRSGPKLLRFWYERTRSHDRARPPS
jgi:glycosyltransferase involved in cell wall biosynthesis